jgi:hypothetical protein
MSTSRREAVKQWTGEKWKKAKEWTLEKCKSKPVRWTVSALSGASLANAMHGFLPTEGAWLAFNIIATGAAFVVSARLTSHGLSAQEEAPQKTQELVKLLVHEALQDVVNQLNENINRDNNNTQLIVSQLAQALNRKFEKKPRRQAERRSISATEADLEQGLELNQTSFSAAAAELQNNSDSKEEHTDIMRPQGDIQPLRNIQIHIPEDPVDEIKELNPQTAPSCFTQCLESLRRQRTIRFFSPSYGTELTREHLEHEAAAYDQPSPTQPVMVYTYQTDLELGLQRLVY